jgi:membrane protein implicated in regulation of membrane protease activity
MRVFEFVIVIVLLSLIFSAVQTWLRTRAKAAERVPDEEQEQRIASLEGRVKVLERIVTDGREDLKRQFDELKKS